MKELIEGLLFVALLKFFGVPLWLISLGFTLFLIGYFAYVVLQSADSRRRARELVAREKQQAEESKKAERARQEAIADVEWNARFI